MTRVIIGLERLAAEKPGGLSRAGLGLLANQASVGNNFEHALFVINRAFPGRLKKVFGPQHGFAGEKQDNMVESDHGVEREFGLPVYSLYGETRKPTEDMFSGLDVLLVDLVDVGTRVYTFAQTLALCLETAGKTGVKVVVLDRPNPIGGREVEGNILRDDCASFVGLFPTPMRHGLTLGELARFMADHMAAPPELQVIELMNWRREQYFPETGLPWVMPSPNMPAFETSWVYPGQVLWEGTNISEGRGTTRPFQLFGAPFIDPLDLKAELDRSGLSGVVFRAASFQPTFHKFAGRVCGGLELHPVDKSFKPYLTSLTILETVIRLYPEQFAWKKPPYEYEYDRPPIDLILGDGRLRSKLEQGVAARDLAGEWEDDVDEFKRLREKYILYS
ncbi:MAG: DUF1343 domain-containing protein [Pseudomonadota bacterium]